MREIEKWLNDISKNSVYYEAVVQAYNLGVQDAAELSKLKYYAGETGYLDKESILKLNLVNGTSNK